MGIDLLARIDSLIDSGIYYDLPGVKSPLWRDGQNVTFVTPQTQKVQTGGYVRPALGSIVINDTVQGVPVTDLQTIRRSSAPLGFIGCGSKLFSFTDPAGTLTVAGTGYSTSADPWVLEPWGSWCVATNNSDAPQIDKAGTFAALNTGGVFSRCAGFVENTPFMFAFNTNATGDNGNGVFWCNKDDVENWVAAATNLAGDTEIQNSNSPLTCGLKLGADTVVYSEEDMYSLTFVGAPFVWQLEHRPPNVGAVGPHAVCEVGNRHFGFGLLGIWMSDGVTEVYIDQGAVREYVQGLLDTTYRKNTVVVHLKTEFSVAFSFTASGYTRNSHTVVYNYLNGTWSKLGFGISAAMSNPVWGYDLMGWWTGTIAKLGQQTVPLMSPTFGWGGTPANTLHPSGYGWGEGGWGGYDTGGTESETRLYTRPLALAGPGQSTQPDYVIVEIEGTPSSGTLIYFGNQTYLDATPTWSAGVAFPSGNQPIRPVGGFKDDFYHLIKIIDPSPSVKWKLGAIEFYGSKTGLSR